MVANAVTIGIGADSSGASKAFDRIGRKASGLGDKLASIGKGLTRGMQFAGIAAAAALTKGFIDALGAEDIRASMEAQLGVSPERAAELGAISSGLYRDAWGDSLAEVGNAVVAVEASLADALGAGRWRVSLSRRWRSRRCLRQM